MAPMRLGRAFGALFLASFATLSLAAPASAFRLVNYNVTNYPGVLLAQRQPNFRTVLAPLGADIVTCQEFQSQAGVDSFRTNVLNVIEPGQWASAPFTNGNDTDNALFYKPSRVEFLGGWAWYPNPANLLRYVNCYRLRLVGTSGAGSEFRIYSQHLKASTGSTNVAQRLAEATGIRDSMNAMTPGTHAVLLGDFNIYTSTEGAYQKLQEVQADNDGRLIDVITMTGTFNNGAYAQYHTQCPCLTCPTGSGFSGGGLDDRFDMLLPTPNWNDGEGLDFIVSTYKPVGNDGLHYNLNINDAPTIPEGSAYATALWNASDHLPVRVDFQLPSRASAPALLALGSIITGGSTSQTLAVSNADAPADSLDELTYSFTPPAGFTAPAGTLNVNEGASSSDAIGFNAAVPGNYAGNLAIATDDPEHATLNVALSGTVLAHAVPSLDSASVVVAGSLDFGDHEIGAFTNRLARVHNTGFGALQARLALASAAITGADAARFSIPGGFAPSLVSGVAASFPVAFDATGATLDQTYEADLTFGSSDEALPGASARPNVAYHLRAKVVSGSVAVELGSTPSVTRLYAPAPNPLVSFSRVRFDLASRAHVRLEAFDLAGRRVATLEDGDFSPGSYAARWDGTDASGRPVGAGLYFIRMSGDGVPQSNLRIAVVR